MSVEGNKKIHARFIEEIWMGGNQDSVDEIVGEKVDASWDKGETVYTRDQFKELAKKPHAVETEFHEIIGEDDIVVAWKTQKMANGTVEEGVTLWKFENGKIVAFKWFQL